MSFQAMAWARKQKTGSPTLKAVLLAVANYADEDGLCWPSQERLSGDTELSVRAVRNALADLEGAGFIVRSERPRRPDKTKQTDLIKLVIDPTMRHDVPVDHPASDDTTIRHVVPNQPAPGAAKPSVEPSEEPLVGARARKTNISVSDWLASGPDLSVAGKKHGLSDDQIAKQETLFQNYNAGSRKPTEAWAGLWENWCIRYAEHHGIAPKDEKPVEVAGFYARLDSPQFEAWDKHYRRTRGRGPPTDRAGGWRFPSEWPPESTADQMRGAA